MTAIVYPATLPTPSVATTQSAERRAMSQDVPTDAHAFQRDRLATQQITFPPMNGTKAAEWRAWWKDTLLRGGAMFEAPWPLPQGGKGGVRQFIGVPQWQFIPGGFWTVTAVCELRGVGMDPSLYTIKDSLLAWWDSTELINGGTQIEDQTPHKLHLSAVGMSFVTAVAGVNGDALEIPALDQTIRTKQTSPLLSLGNQSFAFGRWVRIETPLPTNDGNGRMLMGRWHSGPDGSLASRSYLLDYNRLHDYFTFGLSSDGSSATGLNLGPAADGAIHFVVCSYNAPAETMSLWLDAGEPVTGAHTGGAYAASDAFFSVDYRNGTHADGGDDDSGSGQNVRVNQLLMSGFVMDRAIKQSEVDYLYNAGVRRLYAELPGA